MLVCVVCFNVWLVSCCVVVCFLCVVVRVLLLVCLAASFSLSSVLFCAVGLYLSCVFWMITLFSCVAVYV